mgnify:CR=1 FL=1
MTKKKAITREQSEAQRNAWSSGTPSLIQERATEFNQRMRKRCYAPTRICNSSMPRHDHYTTGFGEVIQPVRPGSDDHMAHPSLFIGRRSWRDGRVEVLG